MQNALEILTASLRKVETIDVETAAELKSALYDVTALPADLSNWTDEAKTTLWKETRSRIEALSCKLFPNG